MPERRAVGHHGTIAVSPGPHGYGFVEPDRGGGQVLFRSRSVASGIELRVGDSVRYALADGGFAREAVAVTPADVDGEERT